MNLLHQFLAVFRSPPADVMAAHELAEAQRDLLQAESGLEYARAMVAYNRDRIARLSQRGAK